MKLDALSSRIKAIEQNKLNYLNSKYTFSRDEDFNLLLKFPNEVIKLPKISFRPYQLKIVELLFKDGKRYFIEVLPRRSGKEVETWQIIIQSCFVYPGLYIMAYPTYEQSKDVLWEGAILVDKGLPTERSIKFLDMIPKHLIARKKNDSLSIELINGSMIKLMGTDIRPDKVRGMNPRGIVLSEFAYSDPRAYEAFLPVLTQNKGWIILQTTFNGMNHAYELMQKVKNNPEWSCRVESIETLIDENGERYITDEMIQKDRDQGMSEQMILQEYYSVVQLNRESMYFAIEMSAARDNGKILEFEIIPNKAVYAFFDLGKSDPTGVTIVQFDNDGSSNIICYFEHNNKSLRFYFEEIDKFCAKHGVNLLKSIFPHDGNNRDWDLRTAQSIANDLGYKALTIKRPSNKLVAIDSMRAMIYRCRFHSVYASRLIQCLSNYQKDYDKNLGVYKQYPSHNWASHGADSFQTFTLAMQEDIIVDKGVQIWQYLDNK